MKSVTANPRAVSASRSGPVLASASVLAANRCLQLFPSASSAMSVATTEVDPSNGNGDNDNILVGAGTGAATAYGILYQNWTFRWLILTTKND